LLLSNRDVILLWLSYVACFGTKVTSCVRERDTGSQLDSSPVWRRLYNFIHLSARGIAYFIKFGIFSMLYVLISVICSVTVSVVIKLAKQRGIQHLHLIVWNYPVAALATLFFLKPKMVTVPLSTLPWGLYMSLAVLLPMVFLCIAYAIQYSGIVKTEIAQRLSLFIPVSAAFFIFHEAIGVSKLVGIAVGTVAILCSIGWKKGGIAKENGTWGYALAVFFGMGIIDVLFKKVALYREVPYAYSMLLVFI